MILIRIKMTLKANLLKIYWNFGLLNWVIFSIPLIIIKQKLTS